MPHKVVCAGGGRCLATGEDQKRGRDGRLAALEYQMAESCRLQDVATGLAGIRQLMFAVVVMVSMLRNTDAMVLMAVVIRSIARQFDRITGIRFDRLAQGMWHQHDLMTCQRKPGDG